MAKQSNVRFGYKQVDALLTHFRANEGAYRGMKAEDVSKVVSEAVGFYVPISTLVSFQNEFGFNLVMGKGKRGKVTDIKTLARFVAQLAEACGYITDENPLPANIKSICE